MRTHAIADSPVGPLTVVDDDGGLAELWMGTWSGDPARAGERDDSVQPSLREQLEGYWRGEVRDFDVRLAPVGTPFQRRVWDALRTIPYGQTRSYGQIAALLGVPGASRAVGLANGRNPIGIVVPCHRVVGSDGKLRGYAGGVERKRFLLDLEQGRRALLPTL
jgi:methylated-DNA-[protein]-cysteine S-methyltransferase